MNRNVDLKADIEQRQHSADRMCPEHVVNERSIQGLPLPDLSKVRIRLTCFADHETPGESRYHTFDCTPENMLATMLDWERKWSKDRGFTGYKHVPEYREIAKGFDDRLYLDAGEAPWWMERLKEHRGGPYKENANFVLAWRASATLTMALEALASSSTLLAGYESATYDNTSNNDIDIVQSGTVITNGTTNVTANTRIEVHIVTELADATWPDVFDGTTGAETITSQGIKDSLCKRLVSLNVDAVTQNRAYPYTKRSVAALYGGLAPSKYVAWITHNTGQNLHATVAGTQTTKGVYITG